MAASAVAKRVCTSMATACKKGRTPLWPEGKVRKNEEFVVLSAEDLKSEKSVEEARQMKGENGLPLTAVSAGDIDFDAFDDEGGDKLDFREADPRDVLKDEI